MGNIREIFWDIWKYYLWLCAWRSCKVQCLLKTQGPRMGDLNGWREQWLKAHYRITGGKSTAIGDDATKTLGDKMLNWAWGRKDDWTGRSYLKVREVGGWTWRYEQQEREVAEFGDLKGKEERWLNWVIWTEREERRLIKGVGILGKRDG